MGRALRARPARSFVLLPLLLLAGCLDFDLTSTVSWSPKGDEVAFLADGKAWVYPLAAAAPRALGASLPAASISWSPDGGRIALAGAGKVALAPAAAGGAAKTASFDLPGTSTSAPVFLFWHPSGERLLAAEFRDQDAFTSEIALASAAARVLGEGLASYGPGGEWLLWVSAARFGSRERLVFDRQTPAGDSLPLPPETAAGLEGSGLDGVLPALADGGARPFCAASKARGKTEVHCLDRDARLRRVARLGLEGGVFADPARERFAVVEERDKERPRVAVFDARGRALARGERFVESALGPFDAQGKPARSKVSRLAWSPDSRWIAWVAGGRLCLWDWAKDEVRVVAPPAR